MMDAESKRQGFDLMKSLIQQATGKCPVINKGLSENEGNAKYVDHARKLLVDYAHPKLKAIEVENNEPVRIIIDDLTAAKPRTATSRKKAPVRKKVAIRKKP